MISGGISADVVAERDDPLRSRLVEAAAEVFAEKGYERAGVQEIASRAGLTTGAIYGRFSGKAELLAEAIAAESVGQMAELFSGGASTLDALEVIRAAGVALPQRSSRKQFLLLEAFVAARRDPELALVMQRHFQDVRTTFTRLVELASRTGELDPELDTDAVVHFCQAVALGFLLHEAVDAPAPGDEAWARLIERLVDALRPGPGTD